MPCRPALILAFVGCVALSLQLTGCSEPAAPPPPGPAQVNSSTPVKMDVVEWDDYVGRLEAIDFVEVRARVSGYLESTNFVEGQLIKKGDLLCVIDRRPFEAEVRRANSDIKRAQSAVKQAAATVLQVEAEVQVAQAESDLAKKQLARSERLRQQNVISQDEFDIRTSDVAQKDAGLKAVEARLELSRVAVHSAESQVNSAMTTLSIAELNLSYAEIHSPISGRVGARLVTEGNLISGGGNDSSLITTIVSLDPIHCSFDTDETNYLKYVRLAREGTLSSFRDVKHPVYVGLADEAEQFPHRGHIDFIDNRTDRETGTMRCRAILPNTDLSLTPGLFARVRVPGSGKYNAVLIPDFAIGTDQSEKFVMVIGDNDKTRRQVVTLGPIIRGLRVIRTGLEGDESFVLRGLQRVRPGDSVMATREAIHPSAEGLPLDSSPVPEANWLSQTSGSASEKTASPAAVQSSERRTMGTASQ